MSVIIVFYNIISYFCEQNDAQCFSADFFYIWIFFHGDWRFTKQQG